MHINPHLLAIQKTCDNLYSYFKDPNVLVFSEDKQSLPFCYVIIDENFPGKIVVSFSINAPSVSLAVNMALEINNLSPVALTEEFYIASNGQTYWGEEAAKMYAIDTQIDLENSEAINKNPF